jgi:hypothetical protein
MDELLKIEAIKRLKYKYFRCLDSKLWEEMGEVLTDNATAAYDSGKYAYEGKPAIIEFLSSSLGDREVISKHMGHHPEITLTGSDRAEGIWYFEDYVIFQAAAMRLRGAGFYHDRYVQIDGEWKIEHTGYARTFEEMQTEKDGAKWSLTHYGDHLEKD